MGASLTGTEAWQVGRAETWGCSIHLFCPDGTDSGWQESAKMTCSSEQVQKRRIAAGKCSLGLERPDCLTVNGSASRRLELVPRTLQEAPNRLTPAPSSGLGPLPSSPPPNSPESIFW